MSQHTNKSLSALYTDALEAHNKALSALVNLRDEMVRQGLIEGQIKPAVNGSQPQAARLVPFCLERSADVFRHSR